jgi:hypothetical protein
MQNGFNDPQLSAEFDDACEKNAELRARLKDVRLKGKAALEAEMGKTQAAVNKAESLSKEVSALRQQLADQAALARDEALQAAQAEIAAAAERGRQEFLSSEEGLSTVERVRRAAEKCATRSDAFLSLLADIIPFYGAVFRQRAIAHLAAEGSLASFTEKVALAKLPDHEFLKFSKEELAVTKLASAEFLSKAMSKPLEEWFPAPEVSDEDDSGDGSIDHSAVKTTDFFYLTKDGQADSENKNRTFEEMRQNPDRIHSFDGQNLSPPHDASIQQPL